MKMCMI